MIKYEHEYTAICSNLNSFIPGSTDLVLMCNSYIVYTAVHFCTYISNLVFIVSAATVVCICACVGASAVWVLYSTLQELCVCDCARKSIE